MVQLRTKRRTDKVVPRASIYECLEMDKIVQLDQVKAMNECREIIPLLEPRMSTNLADAAVRFILTNTMMEIQSGLFWCFRNK